MTFSRHMLVIYGWLLFFNYMQSLRLIELRVPALTNIGSEPELICRWELGDLDVLYSVKWYKDGKEFFRHIPRDFETHRKFYLPGVQVKKSDALGSNITLSPATLDTEGRYRCEVSGERPLFPTVSDHADMFVVVLPEYGPVMTGFKTHYRIGDQVHVNCTCGPSRPVVRLAWYLNGEPAPLTTVTSPLLSKDHKNFDTSSLTLTFKVTGRHFLNGELKVKCLATLASIYWKSSEESAREAKRRDHEFFEETTYDRLDTKYSFNNSSFASSVLQSSISFVLMTLIHLILNKLGVIYNLNV